MSTNDSEQFDTAPNEFVDALETNIHIDPPNQAQSKIDESSRKEKNNNDLGVEMTSVDPALTGEDMNEAHTKETAAEQNGEKGIFNGMVFYLNRDSNAHDSIIIVEQLKNLILLNGGDIVNKLPNKDSAEANHIIVVSPYNNTELKTVTSTFIRACVQSNKLLDMKNYLVPYDSFNALLDDAMSPPSRQEPTISESSSVNEGQPTASKPPPQNIANKRDIPTKKVSANTGVSKTSFTEEEDEFILDVVRKNPMRRTTHTLFDEISHYVPNHTGNSIRHRFRVHLSKRLDFVYQVDQYGKLVRDENGNLIKTKVLPPSIKKKFTADEDYELAIAIKQQFYKDIYQLDPVTGQSLISDNDPPARVAKRQMMMDPNVQRGSEPPFSKYRVGTRRGPIAREFFKQFTENHPTHTESAWRDRFRKFLLEYGVDKYIEYYETQKANNDEPEAMKNLTIRTKRDNFPTPGNYGNAAKRQKYEVSSNVENTLKSKGQAGDIPDAELLDEDTMKFISSLKNDLSKIDNNFGFDYTNEIAEAIRNDFSEEEAIYDNIDPSTIPFPPPIATIDLFLPQFFRMSSTQEFIEKIREIIQRDYEPSQAELLMQDLNDEAGIRKTFTSSILGSLSGDLMVLPRYFLNMFSKNQNPPIDIPGIWTSGDDDILRRGDEAEVSKLVKRQGAGRVEMRKKFLERNLI
ncbi:DNA-binding protein RAP1 [Nakaseomyces glabratus]|nr:DNA-binding protein RAP1 [Nakaseomyces glabratus]KTB26339.1 DNA-binding protein RAP1 [Nakaseomyces glabratus]